MSVGETSCRIVLHMPNVKMGSTGLVVTSQHCSGLKFCRLGGVNMIVGGTRCFVAYDRLPVGAIGRVAPRAIHDLLLPGPGGVSRGRLGFAFSSWL